MVDRATKRSIVAALIVTLAGAALANAAAPGERIVERVTTAVPFPRGMAVVDGTMYVLARGRVRGAGGVSAAVNDRAGTIFAVDPDFAKPVVAGGAGEVSETVRTNGRVFAEPTDPPFRLWNTTSDPPWTDRRTDRPYCTLRYDAPTHSFYVCAFSGIDKPKQPGDPSFSKNASDGLLRYDLRTQRWHEVERHDAEAEAYPHHAPSSNAPPHGWLNGPDNCLPLGRWLYAVSKDNSLLVRYDLSALAQDPHAGAPPSELVLGSTLRVRGLGEREYFGHSALAFDDGWLYIAHRTSSTIVRVRLDEQFDPVQPIEAELVARFDPYDPQTRRSANLTDMGFDGNGRLYVVSAQPARVYRFTPDPQHIFDARDQTAAPWFDLADHLDKPSLKAENVLAHDGWLYVTTGDAYAYQAGADGAVYRTRIDD